MPAVHRRAAVLTGGLVLSAALSAVLTGALSGALSTTLFTPPAHAVVDPAHAVPCAAEAATGLTTLIDPTAPQAPSEIPAAGCLHP
ncbi:hypothetical protein ACFFV7_19475 [Nonomuraea spiralis]|uniref:Uncharacterized protein n=1 Tax=Nonomuraea spiralis TaxID=46182 RepID=A0ABV5IFR4_9ACTN|nr:hypothetical protein [Nonomuraea spiralis]GGS72457.1 hypothetical protein GCM10010176_014450 [Nonomuraea spiralis]